LAVEGKDWQIWGLLWRILMSFAAIGLAIALLNAPTVHSSAFEPQFQTSPCKQGYEWNEKKKKCVRKGLDY
jgi:hypothetical protein